MKQELTKRQLLIIERSIQQLQAALFVNARYDGGSVKAALHWDVAKDGPSPTEAEFAELNRLLEPDEEPDDTPMKDGKPYITDYDKVVNAMLLTDMCMKPGHPLEQDIEAVQTAVKGWTDDERASAFEWAALTHLRANDNDHIKVPPCPPHVQSLRPQYGKPA